MSITGTYDPTLIKQLEAVLYAHSHALGASDFDFFKFNILQTYFSLALKL
jgi:hypothetical protein